MSYALCVYQLQWASIHIPPLYIVLQCVAVCCSGTSIHIPPGCTGGICIEAHIPPGPLYILHPYVPPLCTPICYTSLYTREVKHVYIYREVECMDMSYVLCVYVYQWDVFHLSIHPYIPLVYREVKHVYIYREAECMGIPASFLCTPIYSTSLYTHIFH